MRVYFDGVDFESRTGPNSFALRLARQLTLMGHELADPGDYDVALVFIQPTRSLRRDRPFVQRLDGIWMKPEQHARGMNAGIRAAYDSAASVVWQSQFDHAMAHRWLGVREGHVIHNGVPLQQRLCVSPGLRTIRKSHEQVFVCSANWHPQKRLSANIELYRRVRTAGKSCLIVLGSDPDIELVRNRGDERIFFMGSVSHEQCMEVYSIADWMIHLAWLDHCPNTVVEALSVGTPVVCSSEGGTRELLEDPGGKGDLRRGLLVSEEEKFDYGLNDYDAPPSLSRQIALLDPAFSGGQQFNCFDSSSLSIELCAQRYVAVLQSVLR